jgi:superfamily II DNA helicase RecQ
VAWRGVAWRGVAWRGVAWRGDALVLQSRWSGQAGIIYCLSKKDCEQVGARRRLLLYQVHALFELAEHQRWRPPRDQQRRQQWREQVANELEQRGIRAMPYHVRPFALCYAPAQSRQLPIRRGPPSTQSFRKGSRHRL